VRVKLQHLAGSKKGQIEEIVAAKITVGRNPDSVLPFDPMVDTDVSGNHALLEWRDDGFLYVSDVGSRNGTFVNGAKIEGPPIVAPSGSMIQFGKQGPALKLEYEPQPKKKAAPPPPPPKKGLSTGAKIGIAAGAVGLLGTIILVISLKSCGSEPAAEATDATLEEGGGAVAAAGAAGDEGEAVAAAGAAPGGAGGAAGDTGIDRADWARGAQEAVDGKAEAALRRFEDYRGGDLDHAGEPLPKHAVARLGPARIPCDDAGLGLAWVDDGHVLVCPRQNGARLRRYDVESAVASADVLPGGLPTRLDANRMVVHHLNGDATWVIDASSGKPLAHLEAPLDEGIVVSADGTRIAAPAREKPGIAVFDSATGKLVSFIPSEAASPSDLVGLTADGKNLVYVAEGGKALVFVDHEAGAVARRIEGAAPFRAAPRYASAEPCAYAGDLSSYAACVPGKGIVILTLETGAEARMIPDRDATCVRLSADGKRLAAFADEAAGRVQRIYDATSGKLLARIEHPAGVASGAGIFSPSGKRIALRDEARGILHVHDAATGKDVRTRKPTEAPHKVTSVATSRDGRYVAIGDAEGRVVITRTLGSHREERRLDGGEVTGIAFGGSEGDEVTAVGRKTVARWPVGVPRPEVTTLALSVEANAGAPHALSANGRIAAIAAEGGAVTLLDVHGDHARKLYELAASRQRSLRGLALSPDGKLLASSAEDPMFRLLDAGKGTEVFQLKGKEGARGSASAFSPDGKFYAFDTGKEVHIFPAGDKKKKCTVKMEPLGDSPRYLALSADGALLAAAADGESRVVLFDGAKGTVVTAYPNQGFGKVVGLAFAGTRGGPLVAGYQGTGAIVWAVPEAPK
jgi:WD40 repeat protein